MAKFLSYRSVLEILNGTQSDENVRSVLNRIPMFILFRCNLEGDFDKGYHGYIEVCKKFPLYKDFTLSRFISSTRTREMTNYYIPKVDFDFWTERHVYYMEKMPYHKLSELMVQNEGLYEFYLTRNFHTEVYNIYFESLKDLRCVLDRFCPTDIYTGSFVEERLYRHSNGLNYVIPVRRDPVKVEISISDFERQCCEGNDSCMKCWFYIGGSILIIEEAIHSICREVKTQYIYDGYKGYILHLLGDEVQCRNTMSKLVYSDFIINCEYIRREFSFMLDFVEGIYDIDSLILAMTPDFKNLEYNTYTRMAYSINSSTGKVCEVMNPVISYKKLETDYKTVHDILGESS